MALTSQKGPLLRMLLAACLLYPGPPATAGDSAVEAIEAENQRRHAMIAWQASVDRPVLWFYAIAARLALGQDIERCRQDFLARQESPTMNMFFTLPMMGTYLHGKAYWTAEIHAAVRETWKTYWPARGDTENHWIMWHTALLLAAQEFPDMPASEWANGRSSAENYADALGWLEFWFETTTTIGQGEFDSPDYLPEYLASLFLLYDFAQDAALRRKAEIALHWLLADYALDYLNGMYTGGHSRIYQPRLINTHVDGALPFGYMFFGATPFPDKASKSFSILGALTSYRIPEIIRRLATDRSTPFYAKERKRVRNRIRNESPMNPPVYKHNFMSRNFSIGSLDGGIQQPIQIHTWDVSYNLSPGKGDVFFALHPDYSLYEITMFFPESRHLLLEEVVKSKTTYNKEDKWTGASRYERIFQHKNTLIALYDIGDDAPWQHIDYYFAKSLSKHDQDSSGWHFIEGGKSWIAVFPFKPGEWIDEATCRRLRSPHGKNGYVVSAWESDDFDSWQAFKDMVSKTRPDLSALQSELAVTYNSPSSDKMAFAYPETRRLNGRKLNLGSMPLFDGPYARSRGRVLRLEHGGEFLELDAASLTVRHGVTP